MSECDSKQAWGGFINLFGWLVQTNWSSRVFKSNTWSCDQNLTSGNVRGAGPVMPSHWISNSKTHVMCSHPSRAVSSMWAAFRHSHARFCIHAHVNVHTSIKYHSLPFTASSDERSLQNSYSKDVWTFEIPFFLEGNIKDAVAPD